MLVDPDGDLLGVQIVRTRTIRKNVPLVQFNSGIRLASAPRKQDSLIALLTEKASGLPVAYFQQPKGYKLPKRGMGSMRTSAVGLDIRASLDEGAMTPEELEQFVDARSIEIEDAVNSWIQEEESLEIEYLPQIRASDRGPLATHASISKAPSTEILKELASAKPLDPVSQVIENAEPCPLHEYVERLNSRNYNRAYLVVAGGIALGGLIGLYYVGGPVTLAASYFVFGTGMATIGVAGHQLVVSGRLLRGCLARGLEQ